MLCSDSDGSDSETDNDDSASVGDEAVAAAQSDGELQPSTPTPALQTYALSWNVYDNPPLSRMSVLYADGVFIVDVIVSRA